MSKHILMIAAHPDDEMLGAGGTLARHVAESDKVAIIFLSDGVSSRGSHDGQQARNKAAFKAAKIIGLAEDALHFLDFADNKMDSLPLLEIVQGIERACAGMNPHIIYTHHHSDLNIDHQIAARAVLTAFRPMPGSTVEAIYGMEVLSSTEWAGSDAANAFLPQHYVDISAHLQQKIEALRAYNKEMRAFPHARSYDAVTAQATLRGAHMGMKAAEAFTVIRSLSRA